MAVITTGNIPTLLISGKRFGKNGPIDKPADKPSKPAKKAKPKKKGKQ